MSNAESSTIDNKFLANAMASFIQIGALLVLLMWCFNIVRPFLGIIIWGIIISIAVYPLHTSLTAKLGGREKTSAVVITLIGLAIVLVP